MASTNEPDATLTAPGRDLQPASAAGVRRGGGRYELTVEHGRGGIGRVIRARDHQIGRDVAIKELLDHSHHAEARFLREATITGRLEHPSIVPVHEIGERPDGTPFYAMKLIEGGTLKDKLAAAPTLKQRLELVPSLLAVADAIAYAHSKNIIHRDLKPSNVVVGEYGETMVIDWGLAKDLSEPDDAADLMMSPYREGGAPGLTGCGQVLGTPAYMAPEQARGDKSDARADVYALGAMLYELLTGSAPHHGDSVAAQLESARTQVPPAPVPRWLGVRRDRIYRRSHDPLIKIAENAMQRDPDARYATAKELAEDLRNYTQSPSRAMTAFNYLSFFVMGVIYADYVNAVPGLAFAGFCVAVGGTIYVQRRTITRLQPVNTAKRLARDPKRLPAGDRAKAPQNTDG